MIQKRIVPFDAVDEPETGMLYSDRLGPWFDQEGREIIPAGTEAIEVAVELVIGTFQLRSNLPEIDGVSVAIDFPALTQLIQQDWDRVMGGEDGQLPGRGFLIAYQRSAAAAGRLAEDLLCQVVLERLLAAYWPEGRVVAVQHAMRSGALVVPSSGERCDDLVIVDRSGLILVESKCTIGGWSHLRRMGRKAVRQLTRSARADPRVTAVVLLASSLKDHRVGVWSQTRAALLPARRPAPHAWTTATNGKTARQTVQTNNATKPGGVGERLATRSAARVGLVGRRKVGLTDRADDPRVPEQYCSKVDAQMFQRLG
jgi:hypothetical protein